MLWMCEHQTQLTRWREEEGGKGKLHVALNREAAKYSTKEQSYSNGGTLHYDQQYTVKQIEAAMPFLWEFTHSGVQRSVAEHPTTGAPVGVTAPLSGQTFDDAIAILADISSGYYKLPKNDQEVLRLRFREDFTFRKIGKTLEITEDAARKRVDRAVERLWDGLTNGTNVNVRYGSKKGAQADA